jgi:hypothetical protein
LTVNALQQHRLTTPILLIVLIWVIGASLLPSLSRSLPQAERVIVLLTPGLTVDDLRNEKIAPDLARLAKTSAVGVMPAPAPIQLKGRKLPVDACGRWEWLIPAERGTVVFPTYAEDYAAADGYRTEPDELVQEIYKTAQRAKAQPVIALFDDLCRNDRYAPLAMANVTRAEREYALRRLNQVAKGLSGLSEGAVLVIVANVPAASAVREGATFCPVLLRSTKPPKTQNQLLTARSTGFQPGLLTRNDTATTLASLAKYAKPTSTGHIAVRVGSGDAPRSLQNQVQVWTGQGNARKVFDGLYWLLVPLVPLLGAALVASQGKRDVLYGAYFVVASVLILDTLLGNPLLQYTPLAHTVATGGRYYGLGGAASGLLAGSALLGIAIWADNPIRRTLWELIVVLTLGLPQVGGDTGAGMAVYIGFLWLAYSPDAGSAWRTLLLRIGGMTLAAYLVLLLFYGWRNGYEGIIAARLGENWGVTSVWLVIGGVLLVLCLLLWSSRNREETKGDEIGFFAVLATVGGFFLLDNQPFAAGATALLTLIPYLVVANAPRRPDVPPVPEGADSDENKESTADLDAETGDSDDSIQVMPGEK